MKKIITLALALTMLLSLAACSAGHTHSYGDSWVSDANNHWKVCTGTSCTQVGELSAHIWDDGAVTVEPTATKAGVFTYTCIVCSHKKEIQLTDGVSDPSVAFIAECYKNSAPTKIVGKASQQFGSKELKGYYELIVDTIGGKKASRLYTMQQRMRTVEEGATEIILSPIVEETTTMEYLEELGTRQLIDGKWTDWDMYGEDFAPARGGIALNLKPEAVSSISFADNTLKFVVLKEHTATFFGRRIDSNVNVTIKTDGEVVLSVNIVYSIPASGNVEATTVSIDVVYTYDNEDLVIE